MELEELRLGNWISGKYRCQSKDDYIQVESLHNYCINADIDGDGCWDYDSGVIDYQPIPITPEILEACGFEKRSDNEGDYWRLHNFCISENMGYIAFKHCTDQLTRHYYSNPIGYLHILQNLYHSLIGEELPINLTANQPV